MNKKAVIFCTFILTVLLSFSSCSKNEIKQTGTIYDDAYFILEEDFSHWGEFSEGTSTNVSAWDYDNRNRVGKVGNQCGLIYDTSDEYQVVLHRNLQKQETGLLGFRMEGSISNGNGIDLFFKLTDENDSELLSLHVKNGIWYFGDIATAIEAPDGHFSFFVEADLDQDTAILYLYNTKVGQYTINDCSLTAIYFGSTKENIGDIVPTNCEIYMNYFVNETFRFTPGEELTDWEISGDTKLETKAHTTTAKLTGASEITKSFRPVSGEIIFETYILFPEDNDCGYIDIKNKENSIATIKVKSDGIFNANGDKLRWRTSNLWYILRIEVNTKQQTTTYKINGKTVLQDEPCNQAISEITGISIGSYSGSIFVDDIKVFNKAEHEDYCPEPVKVEDDYTVIINSCNLWREGYQSGWGCVSAFEENEPILGFYDEGIPEEADWEIKMLVENGIDVMHVCWYAPYEVTEPIKRSNHNFFIQDGYMNAEYSDMLKFTFMFENANGSGNYQSFEQFKEYIWKYWVEYYFTDPRFYIIDNRPVFTTWIEFKIPNTTYEEIMSFMNADLQNYGFDGVEIFQRGGAVSFTKDHANTIYGYASANYAEGVIGSEEFGYKSLINKFDSALEGSTYTIPIVGNGFNAVAWHDSRSSLMSIEEFKEVLTYFKDEYLPVQTAGWRQKTLMLGCFNEYGEGHYLMPCDDLYGYGYLEAVKEIISGSIDFSSNITPTDEQKERICHLFPQNRTELRALRTINAEPSEFIDSISGSQLYNDLSSYLDPNDSESEFEIIDDIAKSNQKSIIRFSDDAVKTISNTRDADAIRITYKAESIFKVKMSYGEKKANNAIDFYLSSCSDFSYYYIYLSDLVNFNESVSKIKINLYADNSYIEIKEFALVKFKEETPRYLIIDDVVCGTSVFPYIENDEFYVAAEPLKGFFTLNNFTYTWSRNTGTLNITTRNDVSIQFKVGSDIALIDGEEKKLEKEIEIYDGLPVLPMKFLYSVAGSGYSFSCDGNTMTAYTGAKTQ